MPPSPKPPTVELLIAEGLHEADSPADVQSRFSARGVLAEIRQQAEYSMEKWTYEDSVEQRPSSLFTVTSAGALNPFSTIAKCSSASCRASTARAFARSLGLYADRTIVSDVFTSLILTSERVPPEAQEVFYQHFHCALVALRELLPLIDAGILRFASPSHNFCPYCRMDKQREVAEAVSLIVDSVLREGLEVEVTPRYAPTMITVSSPLFVAAGGHPLYWMRRTDDEAVALLRDPSSPEARAFLRSQVEQLIVGEVQPVLFDMASCGKSHSVLAAGSKVEALFLRSVERALPTFSEVEKWEVVRSVSLPWVTDLSPVEVLRLKEDAANALPRLRELLARRLSEVTTGSESSVKELVRELRDEAAAVEAELSAWKRSGSRRFDAEAAALGLTLVIYGLVEAGAAATGLGAIMATLATAHASLSKEAVEVAKLKARPAYVLVRAKELLRHE